MEKQDMWIFKRSEHDSKNHSEHYSKNYSKNYSNNYRLGGPSANCFTCLIFVDSCLYYFWLFVNF